jgi:FkbM family methyltransferase
VTFSGLEAAQVRENLERVRERIGAAGREPQGVRICAAIKYVPADELPVLAEAGVEIVGENRAQDLLAKQADHRDLFQWHFIGALQSRKVKDIAPNVSLIHSLSTDSALAQLEKHPAPAVLVQVNVAGEESKEGVAPEELGDFIARSPVRVVGLMTMPPLAENPESNRGHFARLAELAAEHGTPAFVKIDVEGFEDRVLAGLTQPVPALSFEFTTIAREVAARCLERLAQLGPYRFDVALGETQRLVFGTWITAEAMASYLEALPHAANSGDVYAVLT